MTEAERYASPGAVEAAITAAARKAFAADPSLTIQERVRLEYFHRFLSRVFSDANDSDWMLKGGTGMLARVASARTTTDVDLFRRSRSLDAALDDLRRLASVDLGDFFRFDYTGYSNAVDGNQQTYTEGYQVSFDISIGAKKKDNFHVDLVVNVAMTDEIEIAQPANALELPKLPSNPYRLYPVVDQIADKVCATRALQRPPVEPREGSRRPRGLGPHPECQCDEAPLRLGRRGQCPLPHAARRLRPPCNLGRPIREARFEGPRLRRLPDCGTRGRAHAHLHRPGASRRNIRAHLVAKIAHLELIVGSAWTCNESPRFHVLVIDPVT